VSGSGASEETLVPRIWMSSMYQPSAPNSASLPKRKRNCTVPVNPSISQIDCRQLHQPEKTGVPAGKGPGG